MNRHQRSYRQQMRANALDWRWCKERGLTTSARLHLQLAKICRRQSEEARWHS